MGRIISDTAYEILRALFARRGRVVATSELREVIGKDPHPVLGRDIIGRGWALKWEGFSDSQSPIMATDGIAGAVLSDVGEAAFELGRMERRDEPPKPIGPPEIRTGKASDPEWWEANQHLFDFDARHGGG